MAARNKLFRKIKKGLMDEGVPEDEAERMSSQSVADRSGAGLGFPFGDLHPLWQNVFPKTFSKSIFCRYEQTNQGSQIGD